MILPIHISRAVVGGPAGPAILLHDFCFRSCKVAIRSYVAMAYKEKKSNCPFHTND